MFPWCMPFAKKRPPVVLNEEEREKLQGLRRSRTEEKRRTVRAAILLDAAAGFSDGAIAWILQVACQKPKDLGYAQELWTYSRLQAHLRRHAPAAGYAELGTLSQSRLHNLLQQAELRPHKVRYYVERRDPEFEPKMATVLHVYKEVEILKEGLLRGTLREPAMVTISYDEKPGIQALASTSPERPPVPGVYAS